MHVGVHELIAHVLPAVVVDEVAVFPRVELSVNSPDAGVIGAATLVLHDLYAPTARKLSLVSLPPRERQGDQAAA